MLVFYGVQEESLGKANDRLANAEGDFNFGEQKCPSDMYCILDKNKAKEHPGWIKKVTSSK
jgi:hypothetical protein